MESRRDDLQRLLGMIFKELGLAADDLKLDELDLDSDSVAVGGTVAEISEAMPLLINLTGNLIKVAFKIQADIMVITRETDNDRIADTTKAFQEAMDLGMEEATKSLLSELSSLMDSEAFKEVIGKVGDELKARREQKEQEEATEH